LLIRIVDLLRISAYVAASHRDDRSAEEKRESAEKASKLSEEVCLLSHLRSPSH
jgi:hypothetical protein